MRNEIVIGDVGAPDGITASDFARQLSACDIRQPVVLKVHSQGGSVFDGLAIGDSIRSYAGKTIAKIESAAFSIASYICCFCDSVEISANGYFMLHNPHSDATGDARAHAQQAELLTKLQRSMVQAYSSKSRLPTAKIQELMAAESFLNASEAKSFGFVDRVIGAVPMPMASSRHLPAKVVASLANSHLGARAEWRSKIESKLRQGMDSTRAAIQVNKENPGLRLRLIREANKG